MKVAIVFSGLIRGDYKKNIEAWKNILDADFYFSAWESQFRFNNDLSDRWGNIKKYKKKDFNFINYFVPNAKIPRPEKSRSEDGTHQHYIFAKTLQKLNIENNYDVIIRARYDISFDFTKDLLDEWINLCYNEKKMMSFWFSTENKKSINETSHSNSIADLIIIYPSKFISPKIILDLIKENKLPEWEKGWASAIDWEYSGYSQKMGIPGLLIFGYVERENDYYD